MSRVVDRVCQGSFFTTALNTGRFTIPSTDPRHPRISKAVCVGFHAKMPIAPESLWATFLSQGLSRLVAADAGVNMQRSGGSGLNMGTHYIRVDVGGIQYGATPAGSNTVNLGNPTGWHHYIFCVEGGIIMMYVDGIPVAQSTYVDTVNGLQPSVAVDMQISIGHFITYSGSYHRSAMQNIAVFSQIVTGDEALRWALGGQLPNRPPIAIFNANNWDLSTARVPDLSPNKLDATVLVSVGKHNEVPM